MHLLVWTFSQPPFGLWPLVLQVECFDTPTPSPYLTPLSGGAPVCSGSSITAHTCRILLLGESGGLYCCRLMAWQETLRTLQVCFGVWSRRSLGLQS